MQRHRRTDLLRIQSIQHGFVGHRSWRESVIALCPAVRLRDSRWSQRATRDERVSDAGFRRGTAKLRATESEPQQGANSTHSDDTTSGAGKRDTSHNRPPTWCSWSATAGASVAGSIEYTAAKWAATSLLGERARELDFAGGVDELSDELAIGDGDVQKANPNRLPATWIFAF